MASSKQKKNVLSFIYLTIEQFVPQITIINLKVASKL